MTLSSSIFGRLEDLRKWLSYRGQPLIPLAQRNPWPDRSILARTQTQYDNIRLLSEILAEQDPNIAGLVRAIVNYVVGTSMVATIVPRPDVGFDNWIEKEGIGATFYRETCRRYIVQGEVYIRRFNLKTGPTLRFIEPDAIRPPKGENQEGEWSFGIRTKIEDTATPLEYNIHYDKNTEEQVEASEIYRLKNSLMNQKRGISLLYPVLTEANDLRDHRHIARQGDMARQAISYFRQHAKADKDSITKFGDEIKATQRAKFTDTDDISGLAEDDVPVEPGSIVDIPESLEVHDPPQNKGTKDTTIGLLIKGYEALSASLSAPYYLVSGDSAGTNYASSLVSESPWVKAIESWQGDLATFWQKILQDSYETLVELGLASNIGDSIVKVDTSSPCTRLPLDEAKTNEILHTQKILSKSTWAARADLDYNEEVEAMSGEPEPAQPELDNSAGPIEPSSEELE